MYCMKCGAQIPDGSEFCMQCGTRLSQFSAVKTEEKQTKTNTNAEKLKSLCSKYKSEYLFENADRFVSVVADILPEDEETVDLMYRCVGGNTGKYLRTLTGKAAITPDEVDGINQWVCEDTGLNGSRAKELTQNFTTLLDVPVNTEPAPIPAPAPEPKPMPRPIPAPAPAPKPAPVPKPSPAPDKKNGKLTYTVMEKHFSEVPANVVIPQLVKATTGKDVKSMIGWAILCIVLTIIMSAFDLINIFLYLCAFASPVLIVASIVCAITSTKLTLEERSSMSGERYLSCNFKAKSNKDYAIAVDDCWIAEHVEPGFSFKIHTPGPHKILLVTNRTKCEDYEEITIR